MATMLWTILRTIGTTRRTHGRANTKALIKAVIHKRRKPSTGPRLMNVITPDIKKDMSNDIKKLNTKVSNFLGIIRPLLIIVTSLLQFQLISRITQKNKHIPHMCKWVY